MFCFFTEGDLFLFSESSLCLLAEFDQLRLVLLVILENNQSIFDRDKDECLKLSEQTIPEIDLNLIGWAKDYFLKIVFLIGENMSS